MLLRLRRLALAVTACLALAASTAAAATISVTPGGSVSFGRTNISPGDLAGVSVTGLPANEVFEVYVDDDRVALATTDGSGAFFKRIRVPILSPLTEHDVVVAERYGHAGVSTDISVSIGRWLQTGRNSAHTAEVTRKTNIDATDADGLELIGHQKIPGGVLRIAFGDDSSWFTQGGNLSGPGGAVDLGDSTSAPTLRSSDGKRVYAIGTAGTASTIYAFDRALPDTNPPVQVWRGDAGVGSTSDVVPDPPTGTLIVALHGGALRAFTQNDGDATYCTANPPGKLCTPVWRGTTGASTDQTPTVWAGRAFIATTANRILAFETDCAANGASCSPLWNVALPAGFRITTSRMTAANGYLVAVLSAIDSVSGPAAELAIYSQATGALIRQVPLVNGIDPVDRTANGAAATSRGVAYVGTSAGQVYAVRLSTGAIVWKALAAAGEVPQPTVANGLVYVVHRGAPRLDVFPTSCTATCASLTSIPLATQPGSPIVLDYQVIVPTLSAFDQISTRTFLDAALDVPN
jgi:outer membrane protein assembly factor BamB